MSSASARAQATACPDCDAPVDETDGEAVCRRCGLVVADQTLDYGQEWRELDPGDRSRRRTGPPRSERRHDRGLGTNIGHAPKQAGDRRLSRLRRHHTRAKFEGKKERNLADVLVNVRRVCDQLGVGGSVIDRACRLATEAHDAGIAKGRSLEAMSAAAVVAAVRDEGVPLPMSEVLEYTSVDRRATHICLQLVYDECDIKRALVDPVEHVARTASQVGVDDEARQLARDLCLEVQAQNRHSGKNPASIAGAAVYVAGKLTNCPVSQREAGEAAGVSDTTVRNRYQALQEHGIVEQVINR